MPSRHERRRLLYTDDAPDGESKSSDDAPIRIAADTDRAAEAYAASARAKRQRRVHDLLPARYLTIAIVCVAGVLLVCGVELLHVFAGSLARFMRPEDVTALDLTSSRNVSQWFASMLLGISSLVAISIFLLRRHRMDDYHGRYRIWVPAALACLLASLSETTDATRLAQGISRHAGNLSGLAEEIVWPSVLGIVLGALAIRMFIEVRDCRASLVTLGFAVVAFLVAATVDIGWVVTLHEDAVPLVARGCWLTGYVLVLATFLLYARHVLLEIEGVVASKPIKAKKHKAKHASGKHAEAGEPAAKAPAPHFRIDLELLPPSSEGGTPRVQVGGGKQAADDTQSRNPSRADRRRMRRDSAA